MDGSSGGFCRLSVLDGHNILSRKGASLQALDGSGRTAVEIAVSCTHADCVTILRLAQLMDEETRGGGGEGQFSSQDTFLLALQVCELILESNEMFDFLF